MTEAKLKRDKAGTLRLELTGIEGPWILCAGSSVGAIKYSQPLLSGQGSGIFEVPQNGAGRTYYSLRSEDRELILAEKRLPLTGVYNFRDLGGTHTTDGRTVRWGALYRSDDLSQLTGEDEKYIRSLNLRTVADFRSAREKKSAPDMIPDPGTRYVEMAIEPGDLGHVFHSGFDLSKADGLMETMYEKIALDPGATTPYRELFRLMQSPDNDTPLMYHCSAGKDRTGFATAMLLTALGVDRATIIADYLLSNEYVLPKYERYIEMYPQLKSMFFVKPEYLEAAFDQIEGKYGSVEEYQRTVLGIDPEVLKKKYLL